MGDAWGPSLAGRLEREAKRVLLQHGHPNGRVHVHREGQGVAVHIDIPQGPARVKRVVLRLG